LFGGSPGAPPHAGPACEHAMAIYSQQGQAQLLHNAALTARMAGPGGGYAPAGVGGFSAQGTWTSPSGMATPSWCCPVAKTSTAYGRGATFTSGPGASVEVAAGYSTAVGASIEVAAAGHPAAVGASIEVAAAVGASLEVAPAGSEAHRALKAGFAVVAPRVSCGVPEARRSLTHSESQQAHSGGSAPSGQPAPQTPALGGGCSSPKGQPPAKTQTPLRQYLQSPARMPTPSPQKAQAQVLQPKMLQQQWPPHQGTGPSPQSAPVSDGLVSAAKPGSEASEVVTGSKVSNGGGAMVKPAVHSTAFGQSLPQEQQPPVLYWAGENLQHHAQQTQQPAQQPQPQSQRPQQPQQAMPVWRVPADGLSGNAQPGTMPSPGALLTAPVGGASVNCEAAPDRIQVGPNGMPSVDVAAVDSAGNRPRFPRSTSPRRHSDGLLEAVTTGRPPPVVSVRAQGWSASLGGPQRSHTPVPTGLPVAHAGESNLSPRGVSPLRCGMKPAFMLPPDQQTGNADGVPATQRGGSCNTPLPLRASDLPTSTATPSSAGAVPQPPTAYPGPPAQRLPQRISLREAPREFPQRLITAPPGPQSPPASYTPAIIAQARATVAPHVVRQVSANVEERVLPQPVDVCADDDEASHDSPEDDPNELRLDPVEKIEYSELDFIEHLGSGEFGSVCRGKYRKQEVAIKQLFWDNTMQPEIVLKDLAKEIESFRHLRHKRLVHFIGAVLEIPHPCLVTEYMPGGSLHHLLHVRRLLLPLGHGLNMCMQLAEGVAYLHSQNPVVVHRDLKSQNVVLDMNLNLKLCDFGLTESMERTHITKRNNGGSPRYMAPELFDCRTKITEKVDIWAMGCIFIEIFGGTLPYDGINTLAELTREMLVHKRGPALPPTIPEPLKRIIRGCHNFDHRLRPTSQQGFDQLREGKKLMRQAGAL